jgi:GT2 family glycosyltransferase
MNAPEVTILVPNYKTPELTKLCLRLLRKFTDLSKAKVVVIDNDSQDASLDYLRSLSWIELVERTVIPGESPPLSHARALDLALARINTPYVLSIHTDTLVHHPQWLNFLLAHIKKDHNIGGIGSWKLETKPFIKKLFKKLERSVQAFYYRCIGKTNHTLEGLDHNYYYLRSHCALYRTDLLRKFNLSFSDGEETAGKVMHRKLVEQGYRMIFLPSETLIDYVDHINHATMILNPELGARERTISTGLKRIQKNLEKYHASEILQDNSLDQ